jgi:hypothetical protein
LAFASARDETAATVRPAGSANAFWSPARQTSIRHASTGIFVPAIEETASTRNVTSGYFCRTVAISSRRFRTPVEVSLWTIVIASNPPLPSSRSTISAVIAFPHGTCRGTASLPFEVATFSHRSENAPCMQQSTRSRTQLRIAASHTPVDEHVNRKTGSAVSRSFWSLGTTRR